MEELPRGEPREAPTAAEAEFGELLEGLLPLTLDFYFWTDRDDEPWMVASMSCSAGLSATVENWDLAPIS